MAMFPRHVAEVAVLEISIGSVPAEGGAKDHRFSTYNSHSDLHDTVIVVKAGYPTAAMFLRQKRSITSQCTPLDSLAEPGGRVASAGFTNGHTRNGSTTLDFLRNRSRYKDILGLE
jgi:predicted ATPase